MVESISQWTSDHLSWQTQLWFIILFCLQSQRLSFLLPTLTSVAQQHCCAQIAHGFLRTGLIWRKTSAERPSPEKPTFPMQSSCILSPLFVSFTDCLHIWNALAEQQCPCCLLPRAWVSMCSGYFCSTWHLPLSQFLGLLFLSLWDLDNKNK